LRKLRIPNKPNWLTEHLFLIGETAFHLRRQIRDPVQKENRLALREHFGWREPVLRFSKTKTTSAIAGIAAELLLGFRFSCFFRAVSCLESVGLGHVLTLFGLAVPTVAFLVIDARLGINPDQSISAARSLICSWCRFGGGRFGTRGRCCRGSRV